MCGVQDFLYHPSLGMWSVCVMYLNSKYQSPGIMIFCVCIDSGFCLSEADLFWVETVVLRVLSWGKIGCLGCFVDSMLPTGNSSNGWVRVCLLGFSVVVHP